jgi:hypothetical protein
MRLPIVYGYSEHVVDGGLISYGVDQRECFRRYAVYAHKILTGTAPGYLPAEFPAKLELINNLRTAKMLGLTIPPSLLARAHGVIELAIPACLLWVKLRQTQCEQMFSDLPAKADMARDTRGRSSFQIQHYANLGCLTHHCAERQTLGMGTPVN